MTIATGDTVSNDASVVEMSTIPAVVLVEGGSFQMGSYVSEGEEPVHSVAISTFYIGKYPVSVRQYRAFCKDVGKPMPDTHHDWGSSDHLPIVNVIYDDAVQYCNWLCTNEGGNWRLPTEAEWEYAARGGTRSKGYIYSGSNELCTVGWSGGDGCRCAIGTGRKKANELGIYDMSGNVWEWCQDWYDVSYYGQGAVSDPLGPVWGTRRVLRGGAWDEIPITCRVAHRNHLAPSEYRSNVGFRVALSL